LNSSNKIFPAFIPPLEDELFSSWFMRLSFEHRIKTISFSKFYFNGLPIWNRDIDRMYPTQLIEKLSIHTTLSPIQIKKLFLIDYQDKLYNGSSIKVLNLVFLNLGIHHRTRKLKGLLYCPGCLSESIPYFRKEWRLLTSVVCTRCNLYLEDSCPNCNSPIAFHRLESGNKNAILEHSLYTCHNCFFDLRSKRNPVDPQSNIVDFQRLIEDTLINGYNQYASHSFLFFEAIVKIHGSLLTKGLSIKRFQVAAERTFGVPLLEPNPVKIYHSIEYRRNGFYVISKLLKNWPINFMDFVAKNDINISHLYHREDLCPFWLKRAFRESR